MKKKKKDSKFLIIVISFLCLGILVILYDIFFSKRFDSKITFYLLGEEERTIYVGNVYQDEGFIATLNGKDLSDEVIVDGEVNADDTGEYIVTYTLIDSKGNKKTLTRTITVIAENTFSLIGEEVMYLLLNGDYYEEGVLAFLDNVNYCDDVVVESNLNVQVPGTYYVKYTFPKMNNKVLTRIIHVNDFSEYIKFNYDNKKTNSDISINITVDNEKISSYVLPSGDKLDAVESDLIISQNGIYDFIIEDKYNNEGKITLQITNIDREVPRATCVAKVIGNANKTVVDVVSDEEIVNYVYNGFSSELSQYTFLEKVENVSVKLYDEAYNELTINCEKQIYYEGMEVHFIAGVSDDDAILIRTNDKTIMIDGGRYEARTKVVDYLKKLGITKIDALIGSHVHWNHVQSHASIIDNFDVKETYYSVDVINCVSQGHCKSDDVKYIKNKLKEKKMIPNILKAKDILEIGEMKLYFIGPNRSLTTYQNANSLVFILVYKNNKFLFTGDTPDKLMALSKFTPHTDYFNMGMDIDVLKMPHHGYENLSLEFYKATTPKYAIFPNCCWCTSKYPSSTNKKNMKEVGTTYYQVCDSKNIVLYSDGTNIAVKTKQNAEDYKR